MSGLKGLFSTETSLASWIAVRTRGCVQMTVGPRNRLLTGVPLARSIRNISTGSAVDLPDPVSALTIRMRFSSVPFSDPNSGIFIRIHEMMYSIGTCDALFGTFCRLPRTKSVGSISAYILCVY